MDNADVDGALSVEEIVSIEMRSINQVRGYGCKQMVVIIVLLNGRGLTIQIAPTSGK